MKTTTLTFEGFNSDYVVYCVQQGNGEFVEVYNGLQRQTRVSKLQASTKYTFRLAAINSIGKR